MKGQWRVVYRFVFAHGTGKWRSRSFDTEQAANTFVDEAKAIAGKNVECRVQPATFRMPRNIGITYDGKIMKRNPAMRRNPKKLEFISYLWNTLIPDVKEAGHEFTAEDLETLATFLEGEGGHRGPEVNGWTVDKFERYLRDTLIPDLRKSGRTETAKDFATGLRYLGATAYRMTRVRKPMKQNPLKLKPLKSNMTELSIDVPGFRGETKILFSYQTPVAAMNLSPEWHDYFGASCIKTSKKWSVTTSKHINQWLQGAKAAPVDQSVLDNLSEGQMKTNPRKRRTVIDPFTRRRVRVKSARQQAGGGVVTYDGVPLDFPVRPLRPGDSAKDRATCGECGRSWDDAISTGWTPAPSGRCPFENFHKGTMKTNPHKRSSKKPLSAKQKAAREKFVKMVRSGAFKKRGRNAPKRDPFGGYARRKKINPVQRKRARKAQAASFILAFNQGWGPNPKRWYLHNSKNKLTDVRADAAKFASESAAMEWAGNHIRPLARKGLTTSFTVRV